MHSDRFARRAPSEETASSSVLASQGEVGQRFVRFFFVGAAPALGALGALGAAGALGAGAGAAVAGPPPACAAWSMSERNVRTPWPVPPLGSQPRTRSPIAGPAMSQCTQF